jgi:hypothetical protein
VASLAWWGGACAPARAGSPSGAASSEFGEDGRGAAFGYDPVGDLLERRADLAFTERQMNALLALKRRLFLTNQPLLGALDSLRLSGADKGSRPRRGRRDANATANAAAKVRPVTLGDSLRAQVATNVQSAEREALALLTPAQRQKLDEAKRRDARRGGRGGNQPPSGSP